VDPWPEPVIERPGAPNSSSCLSADNRKGDEPVEAAVATAKPREPAGEPSTLKKVPELLLDEAGQSFSVAQAGGLRPKGLEMIAHDLVRAVNARSNTSR
jgi:hypothetical protein